MPSADRTSPVAATGVVAAASATEVGIAWGAGDTPASCGRLGSVEASGAGAGAGVLAISGPWPGGGGSSWPGGTSALAGWTFLSIMVLAVAELSAAASREPAGMGGLVGPMWACFSAMIVAESFNVGL